MRTGEHALSCSSRAAGLELQKSPTECHTTPHNGLTTGNSQGSRDLISILVRLLHAAAALPRLEPEISQETVVLLVDTCAVLNLLLDMVARRNLICDLVMPCGLCQHYPTLTSLG